MPEIKNSSGNSSGNENNSIEYLEMSFPGRTLSPPPAKVTSPVTKLVDDLVRSVSYDSLKKKSV